MSVILHLGLPKTGTTTLQNQFFPSLRDSSLSLRGAPGAATFLESVRYTATDAQRLPHGEAGYLEMMSRKFQSLLSDGGAKTIISNENIIGPHPDGPGALLRRTHSVCPNARVIIILRRPFDFLRSLYQQEIVNLITKLHSDGDAYAGGIKNFDRFIGYNLEAGYSGAFGYLYYDEITSTLHERFGPSNVLTLDFDFLASNRAGFLSQIARFIGADEWADTTIHENVSATKLDQLLDKAKQIGMNPAQCEELRNFYSQPALQKSTVEQLSDFISQNIRRSENSAQSVILR